jgi:dipeptidyl aminopeptidase/acylaminoacyl peptidase
LRYGLIFCTVAVLGAGAFAGGTQADYDRAEKLGGLFRNKVYRMDLEPQWFDGTAKFWYRIQTGPSSYECIIVDAETGSRRPAFDHARLARAMTAAGIEHVLADRLPLEKLELNPSEQTIQFQTGGKVWQCDLETYALSSIGPAPVQSLPAYRVPEQVPASRRTGEQTTITFINQTDQPVELFWLSTGGGRVSYGSLEPQRRHQQHTYDGHLWLAADVNDVPLCFFEATAEQAEAVIGAEEPKPYNPGLRFDPARQRPERRRRGLSPDGAYRVFIRDHNVGLRSEESGEESLLTQDGTAEDGFIEQFYWSPDSSKLTVIRRQKGQEHTVHVVESSPADQLQPRLHAFDYLKPGDKVDIDRPYLFDIPTRKPIPVSNALFANPYNVYDYHWSADSKRFSFTYNQRGHQVLRVVGIDAETGAARPVIDESSETFICYSGKYYCEYLDDSGEILWMSERDGWNHLYLVDAATGRVKHQITKGPWVVRRVDRVDRENRQIWFRAGGIDPAQDPYYVQYVRINFDGTGLTRLTDGDGTHTVQYSPDRRFLVDTYSRVDLPPVHELRRCDTGQKVCDLERADWSDLLKTGWQAPERFAAKGRDGVTAIYGIIIRPTTFDPNQSYPVIEDIYAGPQDAFVPKAFSPFYGMQKLAELGFIVVKIDGMGTAHRSKVFHDVCWKNLADAGLPDRILWMKTAAKKYPYMDLSRVGIYGTSAGGQSAAGAVLKYGDFYKVAVADCGCHDNRMDKLWWNEQWMGWPVGPEYEANSNVTLAKNLTGKLLLMVGELDRNVDPASTMQVVNALIRADKDFDLLIVPGAGHGVAGGQYASRRQADYFVRHLLNVEPRAN